MATKLKLPNGATYGYDANNRRICTGSQMGRRDELPENPQAPIKLRMEQILESDYDRWGAYWGTGGGIWCAWGEDDKVQVRVFVRAHSRLDAKAKVIEKLPKARFYR